VDKIKKPDWKIKIFNENDIRNFTPPKKTVRKEEDLDIQRIFTGNSFK